jgi:uncharacterized protein
VNWRLSIAILLWCFAQPVFAARLAIIIDDIGYNGPLGRRAADLDGAFTLAVLPFTPHTRELAQRAHGQGKEIILHAPMSNTRQMPLGKGGLESGMDYDEFMVILRADLADVPHLAGVNNHMGSQLTQEPEPMGWVMDELVRRGLYFVDSRTSAASQALAVAEAYGVPSLKRDVFLDNIRTREHISEQLLKAVQLAKRRGSAVAIGHPYPQTLSVLEQVPGLLAAHGVELVFASDLMREASQLITRTGTSCLAPPPKLWKRPSAQPEPVTIHSLLEGVVEFGYQ